MQSLMDNMNNLHATAQQKEAIYADFAAVNTEPLGADAFRTGLLQHLAG